jgi:hypothetical protein
VETTPWVIGVLGRRRRHARLLERRTDRRALSGVRLALGDAWKRFDALETGLGLNGRTGLAE